MGKKSLFSLKIFDLSFFASSLCPPLKAGIYVWLGSKRIKSILVRGKDKIALNYYSTVAINFTQ